MEKFKAAGLGLNLEEIFIWYFEQKGVENAERFLGSVMNNQAITNPMKGIQSQSIGLNPQMISAVQSQAPFQDEDSLKKSALMKQFFTRKADPQTFSKILATLKEKDNE